MAKISPFLGLRPTPDTAEQVAALPYDVCSVAEAKAYATNPKNYYHITRSEIDLPDGTDVHSPEVYAKAKENLQRFIAEGTLSYDTTPCYYLYKLVMDGRSQTGLLCGSSIADYRADIIKKHEFTRPEKEQDRIQHISTTRAQTGIVFMAYNPVADMDNLVSQITDSQAPAYDFVAEDGVGHTLWVVSDPTQVQLITKIFEQQVPATYIADGHHRAASADRVAQQLAHEPLAQAFLTCIFPANQLAILDYNRVIKDLNSLSEDEFLIKLQKEFEVKTANTAPYKPTEPLHFGMFMAGQWYELIAKHDTFQATHPISSLDVSVLQDNILTKILDIDDPRTNNRVEFVGGIRGLGELERKVNSGEMAAAFSCYPVSIQQLFSVADSGEVMPPKSTWFEPKTRDGLVTYTFDAKS